MMTHPMIFTRTRRCAPQLLPEEEEQQLAAPGAAAAAASRGPLAQGCGGALARQHLQQRRRVW
eukprot:COSAG01_NODE_983_length_12354_cov_2.780335_4_plen_63_part_00